MLAPLAQFDPCREYHTHFTVKIQSPNPSKLTTKKTNEENLFNCYLSGTISTRGPGDVAHAMKQTEGDCGTVVHSGTV